MKILGKNEIRLEKKNENKKGAKLVSAGHLL